MITVRLIQHVRLRLKCDGTRAVTRFRLSSKRTSPFKSVGGRQFGRLLAAEVCASAVVMLDTPCYEVVRRVPATHSIRQFPLHFPSRASPCAIRFQQDSTTLWPTTRNVLTDQSDTVYVARVASCTGGVVRVRFRRPQELI